MEIYLEVISDYFTCVADCMKNKEVETAMHERFSKVRLGKAYWIVGSLSFGDWERFIVTIFWNIISVNKDTNQKGRGRDRNPRVKTL